MEGVAEEPALHESGCVAPRYQAPAPVDASETRE
jgi:hypothetical protein